MAECGVRRIYFTVDGRAEVAEISPEDSDDDVKEMFRAAAEACDEDIIKLYNSRGHIVNISSRLQEVDCDRPYRLTVVATRPTGRPVADKLGFNVDRMEKRLNKLEKLVSAEATELPDIVYEMRAKVEAFRDKLQQVEHLSWLGLTKEMHLGTSLKPFWNKQNGLRKSDEHCRKVYTKFITMAQVELSEDVKLKLRQPTFNNWQWEDHEMMVLMQQMFIDHGFVQLFHIDMNVLRNFLYEMYKNYNQVPFHNFTHAFCVAQMMYGISWLCKLTERMSSLEVMSIIVAALCHDLDHPGYNNMYQINARTELALRYNDISPLENHHCSVAFSLLERPECNIFANVSPQEFKKIREIVIRCILATDMSQHQDILSRFKSFLPNFDWQCKQHRNTLQQILIKVSDISNEARPMEVAEPWIECLLQEFFNQSDVEKLEGLPVSEFMDREKVTVPSSQAGFIGFMLLPLFEACGELLPELEEHLLKPVREALNYYKELAEKEKMNGHTRRKTSNPLHQPQTAISAPQSSRTPAQNANSKEQNSKETTLNATQQLQKKSSAGSFTECNDSAENSHESLSRPNRSPALDASENTAGENRNNSNSISRGAMHGVKQKTSKQSPPRVAHTNSLAQREPLETNL